MNAAFDPDSPSAGSTSIHTSISEAAERIDEVVQAAERVAVELREDARREAEQYLQERHEDADRLIADRAEALAELSQSLVRQVDELSEQSRALAGRVDEIATEFRSVLAQGFEPAEGQRARLAGPAVEPDEEEYSPDEAAPFEDAEPDFGPQAVAEELPEDGPESASDVPEEAWLRANRMAISGRSRAEIAEQLRSEFDLDDPEPLLDQVLGPEHG